MSLWPSIAGSLLTQVFPAFAVIGPEVTLYRTTPGDPATDEGATESQGARQGFVLRNQGSKQQQAAAGVGVWASNWIWASTTDQDVQVGDMVTDGARAFLITATPETDQGLLIAPAEATAVPSGVPALALLGEDDDPLLSEDLDYLLAEA